MANTENPCLHCSPSKMREEGCCTDMAVDGTKLIRNRWGRVLEVCGHLQVGGGHTYCDIYPRVPTECKDMRCEDKRKWDAKHGSGA